MMRRKESGWEDEAGKRLDSKRDGIDTFFIGQDPKQHTRW